MSTFHLLVSSEYETRNGLFFIPIWFSLVTFWPAPPLFYQDEFDHYPFRSPPLSSLHVPDH